ncbi:uncharacterized protein NPIL_419931 [Nephila pilipes]|uniref:Uncharacterized protein n=1 Tax=Nephila pilipes TaxID=299642 RepID=A0A8X6IT50_NEPPI|nr:uncharacterized protein NPIL_419931 [Nephila pilipes]
MASKDNSFCATGKKERIIPKVRTVSMIPEEKGNESSSFDPTLLRTLSLDDPLHAPSSSTSRQSRCKWCFGPVASGSNGKGVISSVDSLHTSSTIRQLRSKWCFVPVASGSAGEDVLSSDNPIHISPTTTSRQPSNNQRSISLESESAGDVLSSDPLLTPSTSTTPQLCDSIPVASGSPNSNIFSSKVNQILENREDHIQESGSSLISPDILSETENILKTLSMDIELSLKNVLNPISLPTPTEIHRREMGKKSADASVLSSSTKPSSPQAEETLSSREYVQRTPQSSSGPSVVELSLSDSHTVKVSILQQRCLQYRKMIGDLTITALIECGVFTGESVNQMINLMNQLDGIRANFWDFKDKSLKESFSNSSDSLLTDMVTEVLQSTFLRLLLEQTETFMARLDCGLRMGKVCAMVLKMENQIRAFLENLESEDEAIGAPAGFTI